MARRPRAISILSVVVVMAALAGLIIYRVVYREASPGPGWLKVGSVADIERQGVTKVDDRAYVVSYGDFPVFAFAASADGPGRGISALVCPQVPFPPRDRASARPCSAGRAIAPRAYVRERSRDRRDGATTIAAMQRTLERVVLALAGLPSSIVNVVRSGEGRGSGFTRSLIGLPIALVLNVAALILVFSLARAIYYPFWAAGASPEQLQRSWVARAPWERRSSTGLSRRQWG